MPMMTNYNLELYSHLCFLSTRTWLYVHCILDDDFVTENMYFFSVWLSASQLVMEHKIICYLVYSYFFTQRRFDFFLFLRSKSERGEMGKLVELFVIWYEWVWWWKYFLYTILCCELWQSKIPSVCYGMAICMISNERWSGRNYRFASSLLWQAIWIWCLNTRSYWKRHIYSVGWGEIGEDHLKSLISSDFLLSFPVITE